MKTLSPISRSREVGYRGLKDTLQRPSFSSATFLVQAGMDQLGGTSARIAIMHDELVETLRRRGQRRSSFVLQGGPLLVVPFDQLPRSWSQITKQSSGAMVRSSSEVDLCGRRCRGIAVVRIDVARA